MLKILFTIILIFIVVRWVASLLLRWFIVDLQKKGGQFTYRTGGMGQPPRPSRPEGEIRIQSEETQSKNEGKRKPRPSDLGGEYVDYEEVK